jgi:uncharacterized protein YndB with AHSA1/START domain
VNEDRIEREISIDAPVERVWAVLTEPEFVGEWFCQGEPIPIDLRPGGVMRLDHGQYGKFPTVIVDVDPPRYFSYRWASAFPDVLADETNSTLVEFHLAAEGALTRLTVCESGFATLKIPAGREAFASFESHSQGWTEVIRNLANYVENGAS